MLVVIASVGPARARRARSPPLLLLPTRSTTSPPSPVLCTWASPSTSSPARAPLHHRSDGVHGGAADGRGAGGGRGGRRAARRHVTRSPARRCSRWRKGATRATRSRRGRGCCRPAPPRGAPRRGGRAAARRYAALADRLLAVCAHEEVPLPPALLRRATHVDLDPASLAQGGVASNGGRPCSPTPPSRAPLLSLAALGGGHLQPLARRRGRGVAAAKASADAPAALSQTLMWDFGDRNGGGARCCARSRALRAALPDDAPLVSDVCRLGYTALSSTRRTHPTPSSTRSARRRSATACPRPSAPRSAAGSTATAGRSWRSSATAGCR